MTGPFILFYLLFIFIDQLSRRLQFKDKIIPKVRAKIVGTYFRFCHNFHNFYSIWLLSSAYKRYNCALHDIYKFSWKLPPLSGSGKKLRNISWKNMEGIFWYPSTNFFQKCNFFPRYFWDPPIFFTKLCIFSSLRNTHTPIPTTEYSFYSSTSSTPSHNFSISHL